MDLMVVDDITANRMPTLWNVDVRLAKRIMFAGRRGVTVGLDIFNMLNNITVLCNVVNVGSSTYNRTDEILAPRIIRLNAKFDF